eukprot:GHVQ01000629.1.p2 GENE.GHVQ01000629.1~~GHVQ01000629.1.p2  ORF type:complete len:355 (+),score=94.78 GHVQ01000629.1:2528-3592(+)
MTCFNAWLHTPMRYLLHMISVYMIRISGIMLTDLYLSVVQLQLRTPRYIERQFNAFRSRKKYIQEQAISVLDNRHEKLSNVRDTLRQQLIGSLTMESEQKDEQPHEKQPKEEQERQQPESADIPTPVKPPDRVPSTIDTVQASTGEEATTEEGGEAAPELVSVVPVDIKAHVEKHLLSGTTGEEQSLSVSETDTSGVRPPQKEEYEALVNVVEEVRSNVSNLEEYIQRLREDPSLLEAMDIAEEWRDQIEEEKVENTELKYLGKSNKYEDEGIGAGYSVRHRDADSEEGTEADKGEVIDNVREEEGTEADRGEMMDKVSEEEEGEEEEEQEEEEEGETAEEEDRLYADFIADWM